MKSLKIWIVPALLAPLMGATCLAPSTDIPDRITAASTTLDMTVSKPASDRTVAQGTVVKIEILPVNRTGAPGTASVAVENRTTLDESVLADNIDVSGVGSPITVTWDTADYPAAEYTVRATIEADGKSRTSSAVGKVRIDGPPTLVFTAPALDTTLPDSGDGTITIAWRVKDDGGGGTVRIGIDTDLDHGSGNEIFIDQQTLTNGEKTQSLDWPGDDSTQTRVAEGTYNLFALVEDNINSLVTVDGLARVIVPAKVTPPDTTKLSIIAPSVPTEFVFNQPIFPIEFGVNQTNDVLLDIKIDSDDNHTNGNEITILSQRFIRANTEKDTFNWDGKDTSGAFVPDGIYTPLLVVSTGSGTPQTVAGTKSITRRTSVANIDSRQVWERSTGDWLLNEPETNPPVRRQAAVAFNEARGLFVLFGGRSGAAPGTALSDTWFYNRFNFTEQMPTAHPSARWDHSMTYDASSNEVFLFGGTDGTTVFNDVWIMQTTDWSQRAFVGGPAARYGASVAFDRNQALILLFGGRDNSTVYNDTWEWDGAAWTLRTPVAKPSKRHHAALAYDEEHQVMVLFGGMLENGLPDQETWEWDGETWTLRLPTKAPSARSGHAMTYDPARKQVVLFGGAAEFADVGDTWVWDGDDWTFQSTIASKPAARSGHAMAFDRTSNVNKMYLFGGETGVPVISLIEPAVNATVTAGQFQTIKWRDDDPVGTSKIRLTIDDDPNPAQGVETGAAELEILANRDAAPDGVQDTFSVQIPSSLTPGTYYIFAYIDRDGTAPYDSRSVAAGKFVIRDPANP